MEAARTSETLVFYHNTALRYDIEEPDLIHTAVKTSNLARFCIKYYVLMVLEFRKVEFIAITSIMKAANSSVCFFRVANVRRGSNTLSTGYPRHFS